MPVTDIIIIILYLAGITILGLYFGWRRRDPNSFMIARGNLPGWVIGISIFGTYLSSNTFLGIPGKAFSENWNSFVFSMSIPVAAWIAVKYFIPYYRKSKEISAYHQFGKRFGLWAKNYAVVCFMLSQLARVGSILFGIGLVISAFFHINLSSIIFTTGILVIIYTSTGGMEAVIWTDVIQSVLLFLGAILILIVIIINYPGGILSIISSGFENHKFSLGSWKLNFHEPTVWVIFLYGFFINLTNFGIDQNYIQRYHAAKNEKEASASVWLLARLYIPVSFLFFFIGTSLFFYTINHEGFLTIIQEQIHEVPGNLSSQAAVDKMSELTRPGIGDRILPLFIANCVPPGISGLIIAAILAAAMSTISSSLNSTATIYLKDLHRFKVNNPPESGKNELRILKMATFIFGVVSISAALAMVGIKSVLDAWWILSGIFSGGLLGLFLLGWLTKVNNAQAMLSVTVGILVIIWMTIPPYIPKNMGWMRSPFHINMIIVIGTLSIFIIGTVLSNLFPKWKKII